MYLLILIENVTFDLLHIDIHTEKYKTKPVSKRLNFNLQYVRRVVKHRGFIKIIKTFASLVRWAQPDRRSDVLWPWCMLHKFTFNSWRANDNKNTEIPHALSTSNTTATTCSIARWIPVLVNQLPILPVGNHSIPLTPTTIFFNHQFLYIKLCIHIQKTNYSLYTSTIFRLFIEEKIYFSIMKMHLCSSTYNAK